MVRNELWDVITAALPARFLCVGCIEQRLGRQLAGADFTEAPINDPAREWMSDRLRDRMLASA